MAQDSAPTPGVGFLSDPSYHIINTTGIITLTEAAAALAEALQGAVCDGSPVEIGERNFLPIMVLDRIESLLVRALGEVKEERAQGSGWPNVPAHG